VLGEPLSAEDRRAASLAGSAPVLKRPLTGAHDRASNGRPVASSSRRFGDFFTSVASSSRSHTDGRLGPMLTELRLPTIKRLATELCGSIEALAF
jgi:hypothetical protein